MRMGLYLVSLLCKEEAYGIYLFLYNSLVIIQPLQLFLIDTTFSTPSIIVQDLILNY